MKPYFCPGCDARVFFENLRCLTCGREIGYMPGTDAMLLLGESAAENGRRACDHRYNPIACNWLVSPGSPVTTQCLCCSYTATIPPLAEPANQQAWSNLEQAKRHLFYSLLTLTLPIPDRRHDPEGGLEFHFLASLPDQPKVLTGHAGGIITINVAEADDVVREHRRISLHEPYRTVLGHLRHEIGHFYWDQLLAGSDRLEKFRDMFGDERQDYAEALTRHYSSSNENGWQERFISRYASAHPWEDWAETWAHYLHIVDALETAAAWRIGMSVADESVDVSVLRPAMTDAEFQEMLIRQWLPLCQYLNAACRSLGEADAYPFVLSPPVIDKLCFAHGTVRATVVNQPQAAGQ